MPGIDVIHVISAKTCGKTVRNTEYISEFISEQFIINGMKYNKNVNIGIIISLLSLTERNSIFEILIKL